MCPRRAWMVSKTNKLQLEFEPGTQAGRSKQDRNPTKTISCQVVWGGEGRLVCLRRTTASACRETRRRTFKNSCPSGPLTTLTPSEESFRYCTPKEMIHGAKGRRRG